MEEIEHRTVEVKGIKMHIAEKGGGPVVLFLHGFPELWYSWPHQIVALSSLGYHAVAPDLRGYGDTDAPSSISSYTGFHIVGDVVAMIDSLGAKQVFLVAHDSVGTSACFALKELKPMSASVSPSSAETPPSEPLMLCVLCMETTTMAADFRNQEKWKLRWLKLALRMC